MKMEGLLPLVYRAIKKNKVHRKYECLSSGASQSYNIDDFYQNSQNLVYHLNNSSTPPGHASADAGENCKSERKGHRRYKTVEDYAYGLSSPPSYERRKAVDSPTPKQLVRFRSHRMFSCISAS